MTQGIAKTKLYISVNYVEGKKSIPLFHGHLKF